MQSSKGKVFAAIAFILAILLTLFSYFLFYRKKSKTPREAALESNIKPQTPFPATTPESDPDMDSVAADATEIIESKELSGKPVKLTDSVSVIPKSIVFTGVEDCEEQFTWEEIKLKNAKIAASVNKEIRDFVETSTENCLISNDPCGDCDLSGRVYYLSPEMIGVSLYASEPIVGRIQHHQNNFYIKPATGQKINFREFLKPEKAAEFDSIFMAKLNKEYNLPVKKHYQEQLENLNFYIEPTDILFTFYDMAGNYIIDSRWKLEEIQPFLKTTFSKRYIR